MNFRVLQDLKAAAADALAMAAMRGTPTLRDGKLELLDGDRSLDLTGSIPLSKLHVTADHMEKALLGVRRRTATALGAPSVPKVCLSPCPSHFLSFIMPF